MHDQIGVPRGSAPGRLSITHKSFCQVAGLLPRVSHPNTLYGASFPPSDAENRSFMDAFAKPSIEMWVMDSGAGVQGAGGGPLHNSTCLLICLGVQGPRPDARKAQHT